MAFKVYTIDGSDKSQSYKYLPASAITPKAGMLLYFSSGKLALCSGTTKPQYVCQTERDAALTAGDLIPVLPITPDLVFETVFSADGSAVGPGSSVTIASDGLRVTATTSSGVAFIEEKPDPGAAGDRVRVRFK